MVVGLLKTFLDTPPMVIKMSVINKCVNVSCFSKGERFKVELGKYPAIYRLLNGIYPIFVRGHVQTVKSIDAKTNSANGGYFIGQKEPSDCLV